MRSYGVDVGTIVAMRVTVPPLSSAWACAGLADAATATARLAIATRVVRLFFMTPSPPAVTPPWLVARPARYVQRPCRNLRAVAGRGKCAACGTRQPWRPDPRPTDRHTTALFNSPRRPAAAP